MECFGGVQFVVKHALRTCASLSDFFLRCQEAAFGGGGGSEGEGEGDGGDDGDDDAGGAGFRGAQQPEQPNRPPQVMPEIPILFKPDGEQGQDGPPQQTVNTKRFFIFKYWLSVKAKVCRLDAHWMN